MSREGNHQNRASGPVFERHYTVPEIAKMWGLSGDVVRSLFDEEPGVIKIERPETRFKRKYNTLRIPESVLIRVHAKLVN